MSSNKFLNFILKNNTLKAFYIRRVTILLIDSLIFFLSSIFSHLLLDYRSNLYLFNWITFLIIPVGSLTYFFLNNYKGITKFLGAREIYQNLLSSFITLINLFVIGNIFNYKIPTVRYWILLWIFISTLSVAFRFVLKEILIFLNSDNNKKIPNIAIYGAGEAGAILSNTLIRSNTYSIKYFIDDNPLLWGRSINCIPIISSREILKIKSKIDLIFLAIPSVSKEKREKIVNQIHKIGISMLQVPNHYQLSKGEAKLNDLLPLSTESLLDRKILKSNKDKLHKHIKNKNICVTGAGGSIGSELCIQIINLRPKRIILFEISEPNLYKINEDLKDLQTQVEVVPVLGNVGNYKLVKNVLKKFSVDLVFHAAAYKHVPMVEANPIEGIANNFYSTKIICEASLEENVSQVILISSDKAVRPTSIMGASKRISELLVKSYFYKSSIKQFKKDNLKIESNFSIVRFGNVLGSSGSVVPLFLKQISRGGPITITDSNIIRYFMTISEAVNLVLETTLLNSNGDIFLLDMGKPIKIIDLAKQIIKLSGLTLKNKENPHGDIEIVDIGLRPGEKLYEELLVDGKSQKTINPLIFRSKEKYPIDSSFNSEIENLDRAIKEYNKDKVLSTLKKIIPEWEIYQKGK